MNKDAFNPLRWGIIGCGNVTEVKSGPAYKLTEGFELAAVMRRDLAKVKDYAHRHGVNTYYTNADELIRDDNINAIYIATPPDSHMHYALKVADAGKPCCIEKPMAPNYEQSLAIYEAFKQKEIPLFIAYYRRSLPRFLKVKEWLEKELIGDVRHINWQLHKCPNNLDLSKAYNWRTDKSIATGGYFDDLASHGLDLFSFLLGDIKEARGISTNQQKLYSAKDSITASWIHEKGTTGSGNWNFGSYTNTEQVQIFGSNGKITFSVFEEQPLVIETKEQKEKIFIENPKHIQLYHVQNMRDHLLFDTVKHPSCGKTAAHTSWVMDRILE